MYEYRLLRVNLRGKHRLCCGLYYENKTHLNNAKIYFKQSARTINIVQCEPKHRILTLYERIKILLSVEDQISCLIDKKKFEENCDIRHFLNQLYQHTWLNYNNIL